VRLGRSPLPFLECEPCETYDVGERPGRGLNLCQLMSQFWVKALTLHLFTLLVSKTGRYLIVSSDGFVLVVRVLFLMLHYVSGNFSCFKLTSCFFNWLKYEYLFRTSGRSHLHSRLNTLVKDDCGKALAGDMLQMSCPLSWSRVSLDPRIDSGRHKPVCIKASSKLGITLPSLSSSYLAARYRIHGFGGRLGFRDDTGDPPGSFFATRLEAKDIPKGLSVW
jgi:hypothetical protein